MIVKMKKVHYTFDAKNTGQTNGRAGLARHIKYLVTDKTTKKFCAKRCDLEMKLNPILADFGMKLNMIGAELTPKELDDLIYEEAGRQKEYFNTYVKNSRKAGCLDANGECFDKSLLFNYQASFSFQPHEYQKILDHCKGDELETKLKMQEIQNKFICIYFNEIKKRQGIKGRKTKLDDIETLTNYHIVDENNPHTHAYFPAYDPVSKHFMNSRYFALSKKLAHTKLEKEYKQFIDQGVSLGYDKIEGKEALRNYLTECFETLGLRQTIDKYNLMQKTIGEILSDPKLSTDEVKAKLLENKIEVVKASDKGVNFRQVGSSVILNKDSFRDKKVSNKIMNFGDRCSQDNKVGETGKTNKMEEVIQAQYSETMKLLEKQLNNSPKDTHSTIKLMAFHKFTERCRKAGAYVDINKQGNCSYIKIGRNNFKSKKNISLTKYKSSLMVNKDLSGSNLVESFNLDKDDIESYRLDHLNHIPNSLNYGKTKVYIKGDFSDTNLIEFEHYLLNINKKFLKKKGITIREDKNCKYYIDRKNQPLMKIETINDKTQIITTSNIYPNESATLLHSILIEDSKNINKNERIVIRPTNNGQNVSDLRHLQVKILFSTDKNSKKIKVDYPDMNKDEALLEMINAEFLRQTGLFDKNFNRNVQKIKKGAYNFTDNAGISILENPDMKEFHEKTKSKINSQIVELITKHDVKDIRFNQQEDKIYMLENKEEIYELASNLPPNEKAKIEAYYEELEKDKAVEPKNNTQQNTNKVKNKRKVKRK